MSYGKLVRDGIPAKIERNDETPITSVLDDEQYLAELAQKITEELQELIDNPDLDEAADLKEAFYALCTFLNLPHHEVERARQAKSRKLGGFGARIYLERVDNERQ